MYTKSNLKYFSKIISKEVTSNHTNMCLQDNKQ